MTKKGFTLVELLLYMGMMAILLGVLTEIFLTILDIQSQSTSVSVVAQDGRFLLSRLTYDIRRASGINQPSSLGNSSSSAQLVIDGTTQTFSSNSGNLVLTDNSGTYNLTSVGSRVSNLSFTRVGNVGGKNGLLIKFTLTGKQPLKASYEVRDYQTTVGIR